MIGYVGWGDGTSATESWRGHFAWCKAFVQLLKHYFHVNCGASRLLLERLLIPVLKCKRNAYISLSIFENKWNWRAYRHCPICKRIIDAGQTNKHCRARLFRKVIGLINSSEDIYIQLVRSYSAFSAWKITPIWIFICFLRGEN